MTGTYVLIEDGVVSNFVLWDPELYPSLYNNAVLVPEPSTLYKAAAALIPSNVMPDIVMPTIGDTYTDGVFSTSRTFEWDDEAARIYWKGPDNLEVISDYSPR